MSRPIRLFLLLLLALAMHIPATAARADSLYAGVALHAADTPLSLDIEEGNGPDVQIGWRGDRVTALKAIGAPEPYVHAHINLSGDTSLAAAGLSWTLGGDTYVRPAIGLAIHDAPRIRLGQSRYRTDLGSRILFAPELAVGRRVSDRWAIEASWVHASHATLFGPQNPGIDLIGVRAVLSLR